jgi:hypothetical protein
MILSKERHFVDALDDLALRRSQNGRFGRVVTNHSNYESFFE